MQDPYEEVGTKKMAEEMPNPKNWENWGADELVKPFAPERFQYIS